MEPEKEFCPDRTPEFRGLMIIFRKQGLRFCRKTVSGMRNGAEEVLAAAVFGLEQTV